MAHTPRLARLRSDDPLPGLSYLHPPRFYPSVILVPRPGLIYVVANTNNIPLLPPHLLPVLCHGPSSPTRPYKTTEMLDVGLKPNLGGFRMKFPLDLHIYILTFITHLIIQICAHYYTPTSLYHHHHSHSHPHSFCLSLVLSLVV